MVAPLLIIILSIGAASHNQFSFLMEYKPILYYKLLYNVAELSYNFIPYSVTALTSLPLALQHSNASSR